jgi:NADH-quinone oxidoreductase subunit A
MEPIPMTEPQGLWPIFIYLAGVLALVATMLGVARVIGRHRGNSTTDLPFESGVLPVGSPQIQLTVDFYLVAILFVIFDLETVFLVAWAVAFFELGWAGFASAAVFILILLAALVYALRCGALEWGNRRRAPARSWERGLDV